MRLAIAMKTRFLNQCRRWIGDAISDGMHAVLQYDQHVAQMRGRFRIDFEEMQAFGEAYSTVRYSDEILPHELETAFHLGLAKQQELESVRFDGLLRFRSGGIGKWAAGLVEGGLDAMRGMSQMDHHFNALKKGIAKAVEPTNHVTIAEVEVAHRIGKRAAMENARRDRYIIRTSPYKLEETLGWIERREVPKPLGRNR